MLVWFPNRDLYHERLRSATKRRASEANSTRPRENSTKTDVLRHLWRVQIVAVRGPVYETLLPVNTPII
jgi:hypothetical protein